MKRLLCWLFNHEFPVTWYGPNGAVEHYGDCSRCGAHGKTLEPDEPTILDNDENAGWVEQTVAYVRDNSTITIRRRYKNEEHTEWRFWEDVGITLRADAVKNLFPLVVRSLTPRESSDDADPEPLV